MKVFDILNRYPLLGTIVCAVVLFVVNGPAAYQGAKLSGAIAGGTILEGKVSDLQVVERTGRRGRTVEDCSLLVATESSQHKVRVECSTVSSFDRGQDVQLIQVDDEVEVVGYPFSGYKFDLVLVLLEVIGVFYFGRKFLREKNAKA